MLSKKQFLKTLFVFICFYISLPSVNAQATIEFSPENPQLGQEVYVYVTDHHPWGNVYLKANKKGDSEISGSWGGVEQLNDTTWKWCFILNNIPAAGLYDVRFYYDYTVLAARTALRVGTPAYFHNWSPNPLVAETPIRVQVTDNTPHAYISLYVYGPVNSQGSWYGSGVVDNLNGTWTWFYEIPALPSGFYTLVCTSESGALEVCRAKIIVPVDCPVPSNPFLTDVKSTSAVIHWNAVDGAESYSVSYKPDTQNGLWNEFSTTENLAHLTGLTENTRYLWRVKTICSANDESAYCNGVSFTTSGTCAVPSFLGAGDETSSTILLGWVGSDEATNYHVIYTNTTYNTPIEEIYTPVTNYVLSGLSSNCFYNWQVRAFCNNEWTEFSDTSRFFISGSTNNQTRKVNALNIKVYPSPVKQNETLKIEVATSSPSDEIHIELFDITGKTVSQQTFEKKTANSEVYNLNINNLLGGIYFLKVIIQDKIQVKKILVR